jgi:hypothetical protein
MGTSPLKRMAESVLEMLGERKIETILFPVGTNYDISGTTGKSPIPVKPQIQKYSAFQNTQIVA